MTDHSTTPGPPKPSRQGPLERLSEKLTRFQDQLDEEEAALLAGILAVAADTIGHSGEGPGRTELVEVDQNAQSASMKRGDTAPRLGPQLLQQFNSAFTADPAAPDRSRPFIIPGSPKAVDPSIVIIP